MTSRPVTIVLMGEPVPFARSGHRGGQHYTPEKQRAAMAVMRYEAACCMDYLKFPLFDGPVALDLHSEFSIPASWSARKRAAALAGEIRPGKRPDLDNLYKLAADALNGIVYRDDAQIVEATMRKVYGVQPKMVVTVTALPDSPESP